MPLHVPLAVRLKTARTDRHITQELRSLSFGATIPGGYDRATFQLDRPLSVEPDDLREYADVYIYDGRSGSTVWQGKLEDPGRGSGEDGEVWSLEAVGPAARAQDRTVPLIYVDRSLERWGTYYETGYKLTADAQQTVDVNDNPTLKVQAARGQVWAQDQHAGYRYRALAHAGQRLARIGYTRDCGVASTDFRIQCTTRAGAGVANVQEDDAFSTTATAEEAIITTDFAEATLQDIVELRILQQNVASRTVANDDTWGMFRGPIVDAVRYNASGSVLTAASNYTGTVTAQQIVNDLLGRLLTMYDGPNATIAGSATYAIEQLAYPDGVTPAQVLEDLMGFSRDHYWAAWEDGPTVGKSRFEWRAWPTTVRYEATAQDGFDSPGSVSDLYNAVRVRWRDGNGRIRTNTRTQTVQALTDAGLTRTAIIDLGDDAASSANADRAGDQFLAEHASAPNAGTLTLKSAILDRDLGRMVSPWEIVPGHLVRVREVQPNIDALNRTARDGTTVFRCVSTSFDSDSSAVTLGLDSPARTLSQIVGRRKPTRRR